MTLTAVAACLCGVAAATEYDFFERVRYPGPVKLPGVDLYQAEQTGGPFAEGYQRRVVNWWPRQGVDRIKVQDGMPLRTWTLRERKFDPTACVAGPGLGAEELTRRLRWNQPRQLRAHLIGFRGIGNRCGDTFEHPPFSCPAVVLRLEDGTKRCFIQGTFVDEDEKYILDIYLQEMGRMRSGLSKETYELRSGTTNAWPDNAKPGEPGTMRVESEHFVWVSGSQHAPNESYSPWVNRDAPGKARQYREGSVAFAEDMWAYQEHAGVLMPYWDRPERTKYEITVSGTYMNGHNWIGGYAGGGYGGCGIKHAASLLLAHEWGHGLPLQTRVDGGGGEIVADACEVVDNPAGERFYNNVRRPWRNCVHGSYGSGLFYAILGDDPNWGYAVAITLPVGKGEASVFHTLARLGEQRGLFANGIRGVGDMVGEFGARLAELDCELQDTIQRTYISVKRNYLEAVDRSAGLYRIPWAEAPEPFGSNIIRLVPQKGAGTITVDFRGYDDPDTYGDWRACIVAVGADGKARYSPLWNKGVMELAVQSGDRRFWLTVAATPSALPRLPDGGIGALLDGRHAYQYPYEVKLSGCRPGTPHNMPGDTDDYELTYLGENRLRDTGGLCVIPHPGDTPEAGILRLTIPPLRSRLEKFKEETDRLVAGGKIDTDHWWYTRKFAPNLAFLDTYAAQMLAGIEGRRHPNGGGWVAASAEVAASAYVAPDAMVLDGAKVLDQAAVEDYAVVRGPGAVVAGHAKVSGQAYVAGNVRIDGYTRVLHPLVSPDKQAVPNEVTLRPFQEEGEGGKLWANYACDRDEKEVLEDWFRYRNNPEINSQFDVLNLNGHLYGQPGFVVDGERRGFRFDGRTQYAEASPRLADLGKITVDMALKWDGGANQTVFDFGTSSNNRIVLTPAGDSGKAELAITREGKTERVVADAVLPQGKWAECRVEIDGEKIALWIDGRKVAGQPSALRPADVYPAGVEKHNFIAASRDGTTKFSGTLDYLRVYHTVFDDFTKAPAPRQHSSRRVSKEFIDSCRKEYGGTELRDELIEAKVRPQYVFYEQLNKRMSERLKEIENGPPPANEAPQKYEDASKKLEERRAELRATFEQLPETIGKQAERQKIEEQARALEARRNELYKVLEAKFKAENKDLIEAAEKAAAAADEQRKQAAADLQRLEESFIALPEVTQLPDEAQRAIRIIELKMNSDDYRRCCIARDLAGAGSQEILRTRDQRLRSLIEGHAELARLDREIKGCRIKAESLRTDPQAYVDQQTAGLRDALAKDAMEAGDVIRKRAAEYKLEYDWLRTLGWFAFSKHYNYPYSYYLRDKVAKTVGGKVCHEDFGSLESLYNEQTTTKWHTRCDWEWRLSQELDGSIEELPMLKKWLERARGNVK